MSRKLFRFPLELSTQEYIPPLRIARIYLSLGQKDQAFEWFEKAIEVRDHRLIFLKTHADYDSLHSDPRFKSLLKKIGLEE